MTPQEFAAALSGIDGSIASKGQFYNDMLGTGLSDAELRALVDSTMGPQSDTDWKYLQQIAGVQNVANGGTVAQKAAQYNSLQSAGLDDGSIRALVGNAVGNQSDQDWNWLTSVDSVLDLPSNATVKDKATLYNDLQGKGYTDGDIRNITQDALGAQNNTDWSWLQSADKVLDNMNGTVDQKAAAYADLVNNSGLTQNQVNSVIGDVAGPQSAQDMETIYTRARPMFQVMAPTLSDTSSQNVGAASGTLAMPGSGYQSSLIQNLRQNNTKPYSSNPGVNLLSNPSGPTPSDWKPPVIENAAFNPRVFTLPTATPQQVNNWNAYSAYRANAISGESPYLSFQDWISQGAPTTASSAAAKTTSQQVFEPNANT